MGQSLVEADLKLMSVTSVRIASNPKLWSIGGTVSTTLQTDKKKIALSPSVRVLHLQLEITEIKPKGACSVLCQSGEIGETQKT